MNRECKVGNGAARPRPDLERIIQVLERIIQVLERVIQDLEGVIQDLEGVIQDLERSGLLEELK